MKEIDYSAVLDWEPSDGSGSIRSRHVQSMSRDLLQAKTRDLDNGNVKARLDDYAGQFFSDDEIRAQTWSGHVYIGALKEFTLETKETIQVPTNAQSAKIKPTFVCLF